MKLERKYKYLVYTYENEYREKLGWGSSGDYIYQGIFNTYEKAEAYRKMLVNNRYKAYVKKVPYFEEE